VREGTRLVTRRGQWSHMASLIKIRTACLGISPRTASNFLMVSPWAGYSGPTKGGVQDEKLRLGDGQVRRKHTNGAEERITNYKTDQARCPQQGLRVVSTYGGN